MRARLPDITRADALQARLDYNVRAPNKDYIVNDSELSRPATHPLDAMANAPGHHVLILENSKVRVLDTKVEPGERTPVHGHEWPAALYVLSWSEFVRYDPDGNVLLDSRTSPARPAVGSVLWGGPIEPHYVENVGDVELHILAVEIKA